MLKISKHSGLSEGVYQFICGLNLEYTKNCQREVDEEDKSQWIERDVTCKLAERIQTLETIAQCSLVKNADGSINFISTVKQLIPFCHNIHNQLIKLTLEQFNGKFGMDTEWTGCKEIIFESFELLKKDDLEPVNIILASLLLFSVLEHSLGDIYVSYTGSKQCPSNLKDLFSSKEMQELLGENISLILYILAGPPQGVNLRNVLWHGFVSPREIPSQYVSFLLYVIASISFKFAGIQIKRRPIVTLSHFQKLCIFPNIGSSKSIATVDQLFMSSFFITPSMLPIWKKALRYFEEKRYGLVMVLLLPQLEHSLRRVFAYVNKCPERILTAESTTLYTTFDEILAASLPDGSDNQLRKEIGDEYLQMLLDILVYTDGPRIRDRISHGELNLNNIPSEISNHLLCICVAFASLFSPGFKKITCSEDANDISLETTERLPTAVATTAKDSQMTGESFGSNFIDDRDGSDLQSFSNLLLSDDNDTIQQIILKANKYQSVYHPIEILKRDIEDLSKITEKFDSILSPETEVSPSASKSKVVDSEDDMLQMMGVVFESQTKFNNVLLGVDLGMILVDDKFSKGVSLLCKKSNVTTIYRPRKELEVVSIYSSIVQHCTNMSCQIITTANHRYQQWSKKELRSRQRTNYKRLLSLLPFFKNIIKIVSVFILIELPSLKTNTADGMKADYLKFLKRCLQSSENMESLSGPSKNKWDECKNVGEQLMDTLHKRLTEINR